MGAHAVELFPQGARVLTHCNAGGLATGGYGTAVGAIRAAWEAGRVRSVWVDETRPLLQGARLTAWELEQLGIEHAVIVDGAAASRMSAGEVDLVVTGADRIAANGDTANKIGTYALAVIAHHHAIPLIIVAPTSTLDPATPTGDGIVVEERDAAEITIQVQGAKPGLRCHPGGAHQCDRHRARDPSSAVRLSSLMIELTQLEPETRAILDEFGFDAARFERLRTDVAAGQVVGGDQRRHRSGRGAASRRAFAPSRGGLRRLR